MKIIYFSLGFVLLLFCAVYLFTRPALSGTWDISNFGQIGDTIGGITAPIIGIVGAILVFISFNEQVKANKIQFKALLDQRDFDLNFKLWEDFKMLSSELEMRMNGISLHGDGTNWDDLKLTVEKDLGLTEANKFVTNDIDFLSDELGDILERVKSKEDLSTLTLIKKTLRLYDRNFSLYFKNLLWIMDNKKLESITLLMFKTTLEVVANYIDQLTEIRNRIELKHNPYANKHE